jgi:hypothetical protein
MITGLLKIASAGDARSQVSPVERWRDAVIKPLHDERRHANRWQRRANIDLGNHARHAQERARADRHPLEPRKQFARRG